jgi:hypothetical protein
MPRDKSRLTLKAFLNPEIIAVLRNPAVTFCCTTVLVSACMLFMAPAGRSQEAGASLSNKEIINLCNRHTKQSSTSVSFDFSILDRVAGKIALGKNKLIEVSDTIYYLIGQEETDCRLLLLDKISREDYRANQEKRLDALLALHQFRENAQKAAGEKVEAKPTGADPRKLLEELGKLLPGPKGVVKRGFEDLQGPIDAQLNEVIKVARKAGDRDN